MFDALTMRAVADELTTAIVGGRIQRVGLADERTLVLEIFAHGTRHSTGSARPSCLTTPDRRCGAHYAVSPPPA
ncbi:MAG: NFACT family protein [Thermomicrobia bacterium]|nr:NFACT family protein [Thermomicrobia bacterium]